MEALLQRTVAAYLFLVGVAVGAYSLVSPLYAARTEASTPHDIWGVINWFMAIAFLLLTLVTCARRQALREDAPTWEQLVAHGRFYLSLVFLMAFLGNWFAEEWGDGGSIGLVWVVLNIGLFALGAAVGLDEWRRPNPPWRRRR